MIVVSVCPSFWDWNEVNFQSLTFFNPWLEIPGCLPISYIYVRFFSVKARWWLDYNEAF